MHVCICVCLHVCTDVCLYMAGWLGGWMDGWTDGWAAGWRTGEQTNEPLGKPKRKKPKLLHLFWGSAVAWAKDKETPKMTPEDDQPIVAAGGAVWNRPLGPTQSGWLTPGVAQCKTPHSADVQWALPPAWWELARMPSSTEPARQPVGGKPGKSIGTFQGETPILKLQQFQPSTWAWTCIFVSNLAWGNIKYKTKEIWRGSPGQYPLNWGRPSHGRQRNDAEALPWRHRHPRARCRRSPPGSQSAAQQFRLQRPIQVPKPPEYPPTATGKRYVARRLFGGMSSPYPRMRGHPGHPPPPPPPFHHRSRQRPQRAEQFGGRLGN